MDLRVGTLDGAVTRRVQRDFPESAKLYVGRGKQPFAIGPFGTKVLYGFYGGKRSELHVVDAVSGRDDLVLADRRIVYNAVLDPATNVVLFGLVDPTDHHDLGVWRLEVGRGKPATILVPPRTDLPADVIPGLWNRALLLTPDGSKLVVRDCARSVCEVDVHTTSDGALLAHVDALRQDSVFGVTDHELVGILRACPSASCEIDALDLESGAIRRLSDDPCAASGYGVLAASASGAQELLVPVSLGQGCPAANTVIAIDISTATARTVWPSDEPVGLRNGLPALAIQATGAQGYSTPDGWFLLAPDQMLVYVRASDSTSKARLVNLSDGTELTIEIPGSSP